jgi:hypothetical protein
MRYPRQGGPIGRAAILGLLLLAALSPGALAGVPDGLRGSWAAAPSTAPAMEWASTEDGFTVSWTPQGAEATTVHFSPATRPGIYAGKAKAGWSMMDSMFGDDGPVNPLDSGTLFWARTAADTVFIYRLAIGDDGAFQIDRYACRPADGALALSVQRRTAAGMAAPIEQRLVRVGQ